jgi:hypothetical protein
MQCRKGRNVTDKISNLILSLPNIRRKVWSKNNPNRHSSKSALWYATADMIVLKDGIIPCVSKVSPDAYEKQMLKMLDENTLYEKVKNYLKTTGWIILGGQPARGTNHLPVIEVKDSPSRGSKGSKKSI